MCKLASTKVIVRDFHNTHFNTKNFVFVANRLVRYLKRKYKDELADKAFIEPCDICTRFKKVEATYCIPEEGVIQIGTKYLKYVKSLEYRYEREYRVKWCTKKSHFAIWLLLHEFCHLWKHRGSHHKKSFFKHINRIAEENPWIFD